MRTRLAAGFTAGCRRGPRSVASQGSKPWSTGGVCGSVLTHVPGAGRGWREPGMWRPHVPRVGIFRRGGERDRAGSPLSARQGVHTQHGPVMLLPARIRTEPLTRQDPRPGRVAGRAGSVCPKKFDQTQIRAGRWRRVLERSAGRREAAGQPRERVAGACRRPAPRACCWRERRRACRRCGQPRERADRVGKNRKAAPGGCIPARVWVQTRSVRVGLSSGSPWPGHVPSGSGTESPDKSRLRTGKLRVGTRIDAARPWANANAAGRAWEIVAGRAGPEDAFTKHSSNMLGQILKSRRAGGGAPTGGLGSGGPTARDTDVWRLGQAGAGRLQ